MKLVVDANVLVAESVRRRGKELFTHPVLRLSLAEYVWGEARYELPRRLLAMERHGRIPLGEGDALLRRAVTLVDERVSQVAVEFYGRFEDEARARIPRDHDDWHTVALALALDAGTWTGDNDFLGCGIATWTTDTLTARDAR